ncbi:DMT family transporter [uncultured Tateyamaria sp.]|uniref:DMT family transporter n=1 Tax=uncultured Tateyamaria sp. TaxID=455651 RepID=UPI0026141AD7|nr:DMT family transporter [uncultured Tateyamaria sp.]
MCAGLAIMVGLDLKGLGGTWARGAALSVLAGAMWGGYTVLLRLWQIPIVEGTLAVTGGSAIIAVPLLAITASETLLVTPSSAIALQVFMQGLVGGIISVVTLIGAARSLPVHVSALLPVFTPVVALGIASVALGAIPNTAEMAGTLIIAAAFMISLGILNRKKWLTARTATGHS